jgi:hypothetical protein
VARAAAIVLVLLVAGSGAIQLAHGAAAERSRAAASRCDADHSLPAIHAGAPEAAHDRDDCAQCQAFASARSFAAAARPQPPRPTCSTRLSHTPEIDRAARAREAAPPARAPPSVTAPIA